MLRLKTLNEEIHNIYNVEDFPYTELNMSAIKAKKGYYLEDFATFDIETTTFQSGNDEYTGFMYIWQCNMMGYNIFGRTWEEFIEFMDNISVTLELNKNRKLVFYVHYLAYEFQFIKDFFELTSMFAREKRKPMKCVFDNVFEFRCSYFLSNMSLSKFCENSSHCKHYKLQDMYNYKIFRSPTTQLTDLELEYCLYDVLGLRECIQSLLIDYDDTLDTIPLTSTGYVRRDFRIAIQSDPKNMIQFKEMTMDLQQFEACQNTFRGGDTHASRFMVDTILHGIDSWDKKSSYPSSMFIDKFPVKAWRKVTVKSKYDFYKYLQNYACMFSIDFENIYTDHPFPYIPLSKCEKIYKYVNDNGRILKAERLRIWLTELDFDIIERTYNLNGGFMINEFYYSEKGYLSDSALNTVYDYFYKKTTLEDSDYYYYLKSKNKLNSTYGLYVSNPVQPEIFYDPSTLSWKEQKTNKQEQLEKYYKSKKSFLNYQQGIYVTANARHRLWDGITGIDEMDLVYIDTDSIKHDNDYTEHFEKLNIKIREESEKRNAYVDYNGNRIYLGVWEHETEKKGLYQDFKTLGSKKYCYKQSDKFTVTVSGMGKKEGSKVIGDAENFNIGQTYHEIGRTVSYYNDYGIYDLTLPNGETILNASNIAVVDTTYTLGVTHEYYELLYDVKKSIDNSYQFNYNRHYKGGENMITRTFPSKVKVLVLDKTLKVVEDKEVTYLEMLDLTNKYSAKDGYTVKSATLETSLYGMSEMDFVKSAKVLKANS